LKLIIAPTPSLPFEHPPEVEKLTGAVVVVVVGAAVVVVVGKLFVVVVVVGPAVVVVVVVGVAVVVVVVGAAVVVVVGAAVVVVVGAAVVVVVVAFVIFIVKLFVQSPVDSTVIVVAKLSTVTKVPANNSVLVKVLGRTVPIFAFIAKFGPKLIPNPSFNFNNTFILIYLFYTQAEPVFIKPEPSKSA
jgi:hypothetical protein